jgi:hypothetical protein
MKKKAAVTYLVSGDGSVSPSEKILERAGRRVRFDTQVDIKAARALKPGQRYVVVAHGTPDGVVMWFRSDATRSARWLWRGMPNPPTGARIYLYSCYAGKELPHTLKHCECFGHTDEVPMPAKHSGDVVVNYLDAVHELMVRSSFDRVSWREELGRTINDALVRELESPSKSFMNVPKLLLLRKSLGYVDE